MVNQAVAECYATLVDPFDSTAGRDTPHRGADYRRGAGQTVVAYEDCTIIDSDLKSQYLGYSVVAKRHRDGKFIGWAHLVVGTRPANGAVIPAGNSVGLVAGWNDFHGSSWSGPHIHTTEGTNAEHIYSGRNSDPSDDIAAAVRGVAPGGGNTAVNYHWYKLSPDSMGAMQDMAKRLGVYNGPIDNDFGENSVKAMQELGKRWGYLAGDYEVDGIPHNPNQEDPSNYGFFLQRWAVDKAGYDGIVDGLPAGLSSQFLVLSANRVMQELASPSTPPPVVVIPPVVTPPTPTIPSVAEGFVFFPDLGTSQGDFNFAEYAAAGGRYAAIKFGGGNASDSPYIAPRYKDQMSRARAQQIQLIHYWFNGNKNGLTPEASADYLAQNIDLKLGEIVALDIEDEVATQTAAWTPEEVVRYIKQLRKHFPGIKGLVYMSDSVADAREWDEVAALGWELWSASWGNNDGEPGTPPSTDDWPSFTAWQYSSKETVPGNGTANTDGNMGKADTWTRLGWQLPVVVEPTPDPAPEPVPDPEPEPVPEPTPEDPELEDLVFHYMADLSRLNGEYAVALQKKRSR